ncbi:hypothetical protein EDD86DRAFT_212991 [Gorgonomyces haynaldii]|nr:hypothetical protein EDD86DRAFT_212991 [Gorgonomyces haynaldii]
MHHHSDDIFFEPMNSVNIMNADIMHNNGKTDLVFGVPFNQLENSTPMIVIGRKGTVMNLKRFNARQRAIMDALVNKGDKKHISQSLQSQSNEIVSQSQKQEEEEDPDASEAGAKKIIKQLLQIWNQMFNSPQVRKIRLFMLSHQFAIFTKLVIIFFLTSTIIAMTFIYPGQLIKSEKLYNFIHISFILLGQIVFFFVISLLQSLHALVVSSKASHKGAKLKEFFSTFLSSQGPAYSIRRFLAVLGFALPVTMSITAYNFKWMPLETLYNTSGCIPATYPKKPIILPDTGNFLQGEMDFATINSYGIPLQDGIIGGWSAWPLEVPSTTFSISSKGVGYLVRVHCFNPTAATVTQRGVVLRLSNYTIDDLTVSGYLTVYTPPNSMILDNGLKVDGTNGYNQKCKYEIIFTNAIIRFQFVSDEWGMLLGNQLLTMTIGSKQATKEDSGQLYYSQFEKQTTDCGTPFPKYFLELMQQVFDGQMYLSSQGSVVCNLLGWSTRPDGYYHNADMDQGIAGILAASARYLLVQYDGAARGACEYYSYNGAGIMDTTGSWPYLVIVESIILMLGLGLHIWWIHLIYKIDNACDQVMHSIRSPVRCAHDMMHQANLVFGQGGSKLETLNGDLEKVHGETMVVYGALQHSLGSALAHFGIGLKKRVIPIHKLMKKKK